MKQAGDLVSVLKEANQVVNPKLFEMMEMSKSGYGGKGRSRWKGSNDQGGRSDRGGYGSGMGKDHRRDSSSFGVRSRDRSYGGGGGMDRKFGGSSGGKSSYMQNSQSSGQMNGYGSMNGSLGGGMLQSNSVPQMYNQYQMQPSSNYGYQQQ